MSKMGFVNTASPELGKSSGGKCGGYTTKCAGYTTKCAGYTIKCGGYTMCKVIIVSNSTTVEVDLSCIEVGALTIIEISRN